MARRAYASIATAPPFSPEMATSEIAIPIDRVPPVTSDRAIASPVYPVDSIARSTAAFVSSATARVPFTTCETVVIETPASSAMSRWVGRDDLG